MDRHDQSAKLVPNRRKFIASALGASAGVLSLPGELLPHVVHPQSVEAVETPIFEINRKEKSVTLKFADGNEVDGVGDIMEVGGINLRRHERCRIALYDHGKEITLPIGLCESKQGNYTVSLRRSQF